MKNILLLIVGGFAIGILLAFLNIQFNFWGFVVILILAFAALSYRDVRYMFLSKDIDKIERYLEKKRHEPYYGFILELANGNLSLAKNELDELERKWKGKKTAVFWAQYYLKAKNLSKAKEKLEQIEQVDIRTYIQAGIAVEEKNFKVAEEFKSLLSKDWMKLAIELEMALGRKNYSLAKEKKEQALAVTKGLQYYMLYREFEQLKGDSS
ncbi:hypothetical protein [Sutcliffiella rhizosphaerae]|uniref:Tetratricopeptide repeat protein n=1 Tax=Sutcliffiella rhizosphaerae TaxID=2880967 RepID=A0ABN8AB31_9BACI|nr:hypothetical protein [Sutcliffiella rhizosphaerae]CAG9620617.1 hypothetical protein BACCIP111883_01386 [Sutcliffiella rhizosphaerae]